MKRSSYAFLYAALILLGGLTPAWSLEKVLVAGDPPLTQEVVDLYQQMWEWYCDLRLSPEQRRHYQQHFANFRGGAAPRHPPYRRTARGVSAAVD